MKKNITIFLLLVCVLGFFAFKPRDRNQTGDKIYIQNYPLVVDSKLLDANTISTWFRNNGSFNRNPTTGNSGFEWPKGSSKFARYASGLWLGAVVGGDTLIAMAEYDYEYLPGYTDNSGNPQAKDDPLYKVYKMTKGLNDENRSGWPNILLGNSDQGAPVFFDSSSNSWKPLDFGSQTMFYVYTDSYPEAHANNAGSTTPLKADIKQVNFSFNFGGPLGRIAITQFTVINRNSVPWNDAYLTLWTDDDLGDATDDLVGVDSALGLGYTYNGDNDDGVYGAAPPAVGYDFFRGAIIFTNDPNDTAYVCDGKTRVAKIGYRQIGLTVFNWYANGHPIYGDPRIYRETYRQMKGLRREGDPIIHPDGYTTTFIYSGDPVTNSGWVHTGPDDQRFLQSTGPFTMNPGDTQVIVAAQVIARGSSNLNSITELRLGDVFAQKIYDNCFNVPSPPPNPVVTYWAPGNGKIYLAWDDAAEKSKEFNLFNNSYYNFQGYNVYQVRAGTDGSNASDRVLLATYDIIDGITDVYDSVFLNEYNNWVNALVQKGYDNGVRRVFVLDRDNISGSNLINGTPYYISVTGYSYDSLSGAYVGTTKINESPVSGGVLRIVPQALVQGSQINYNFGDTILTNRKDLGVVPMVTDPISLINANYKTTYGLSGGNLAWTLTRTLNGTTVTLEQNNRDFSGTQDTAKTFDGFMLIHQRQLDSGIVIDSDDPLRFERNLKTLQKGWTYTPAENQWVKGYDTTSIKNMPSTTQFKSRQFQSRSMGLSWPYQGSGLSDPSYRNQRTKVVANGTQFVAGSGNNTLSGGPLRKVRIRFGQTQKAYMFVPTAPLPNDTALNNIPIGSPSMVDVPFQVFAADDLDSSQGNERQLNCAFIDADANGVWDPDTTRLGKFQIVYIFASSYDENPSTVYTSKNIGLASPSSGFPAFDIMYVWGPRVMVNNGVPMSYTNGDVLEIYPYIISRSAFVPGYPVSYSWNVQGSQFGNNSLASSNNQMEKVKVFPNPYYGSSRLETDPINRFVYFSNLPRECTIYIYTLSGYLVRKFSRNVSDPRNSLERWDLRNSNDIPVASGMYIALIDAPGIGTKILKLAIFTPEERIDTY